MKIGNIEIPGHFGLAPMAGVTDRAFRRICAEHGASYCVSEMVSAKALTYHDKKTAQLLDISDTPCPCAVQLFGSDPDTVAEGLRIARELSGAPIVDINMGCPMPKITGNGEGSALLRDPARAWAVCRAAVQASDVPVTVKFRTGWDSASINCVEIARRLDDAGAAALCIHGRTRAQGYSGLADRDLMAQVVAAVSIPVMVNGDINTPEDGTSLLQETGADFAMIGRGALGSPWLFAGCEAAARGEPLPEPPDLPGRLAVLLRQAELTSAEKSEYVALREMRKHAAWYLKGFRGAAACRNSCMKLTTLAGLRKWIEETIMQLS